VSALTYSPPIAGAATSARRDIRTPLLAGARDMSPVLLALAPVALTLGAGIAAAPIDARIAWVGAIFVYAASAHATAIAMLGGGAAGPAVVLAALLLTTRSIIYSAGLVTRMQRQPGWFRWTAPYLLVDPLFALVTSRTDEEDDPWVVRWYYLGAGLAIWVMWMPAMALGIVLGPVIPNGPALRFALPALLIAFLVPGLRSRPAVVAAAVGAVVGAAMSGLPGSAGLVLATVLGMAAAVFLERRSS